MRSISTLLNIHKHKPAKVFSDYLIRFSFPLFTNFSGNFVKRCYTAFRERIWVAKANNLKFCVYFWLWFLFHFLKVPVINQSTRFMQKTCLTIWYFCKKICENTYICFTKWLKWCANVTNYTLFPEMAGISEYPNQ